YPPPPRPPPCPYPTLSRSAADPEVLASADLAAARRLFVTIPEPFEAGQVVQQARALNPTLDILARAHSDAAVTHLAGLGASLVRSEEHTSELQSLAYLVCR